MFSNMEITLYLLWVETFFYSWKLFFIGTIFFIQNNVITIEILNSILIFDKYVIIDAINRLIKRFIPLIIYR